MRKMMSLDFIVMRSAAPAVAITSVIVVVALVVGMRSLLSPLAAVAAMVPLLMFTTLGAYDDNGGWGSFRLALPLSRAQVVAGRYASLLLAALASGLVLFGLGAAVWAVASFASGEFAAGLRDFVGLAGLAAGVCAALSCALVACAVALPLFVRFGLSKGVRFVPLIVAIAFAFGMAVVSSSGSPFESTSWGIGLIQWLDGGEAHLLVAAAVVLAASLLVYAASALVAVRLYARREL